MMLTRMRNKGSSSKYTFGEYCLFIAMLAIAIITGIYSILGFLSTSDNIWALTWTIPCFGISVVSFAGWFYVLDGYDNDDEWRDSNVL